MQKKRNTYIHKTDAFKYKYRGTDTYIHLIDT